MGTLAGYPQDGDELVRWFLEAGLRDGTRPLPRSGTSAWQRRELVKEMILTLAHERPNVYALQNLGFSEERNPYEDPRMPSGA
jgi:hypothetical protein